MKVYRKVAEFSRRKFIKRGLLTVLGTSALDAFAVEPSLLQLQMPEVRIRGLGASFDGYKIALLSDFHIPRASAQLVQRAIEIAKEQKPDLFVMPGDFVHGYWRAPKDRSPLEPPSLRGYFETAAAPDGVWGTLGNHDHWLGASSVREAVHRETPVRLIDNENVILRRGADSLALVGIGDLWARDLHYDKAFEGIPDDVPRILLSHNPDMAEIMPKGYRVDLQLSGHTHGGEIRWPWGPAPVIPSNYGNKFRQGLVQGKRNLVYVTAGVATVSHARFFCRPEVTVLVLRSA